MKLNEISNKDRWLRSQQLPSTQPKLPSFFDSGVDFMRFVYDRWPSRDTHVEQQSPDDWSAEIHGGDTVTTATFDEQTGKAYWFDENYDEIE